MRILEVGGKILKKIGILLWEGILIIFLVGLFSGIGIVSGLAYLYFYEAPDLGRIHAESLPQTTILYDRSGEHVLYQLYGEENRKIVGHDGIADSLREATIAAEDTEFYQHFGVDPVAVLRALKANLERGGIEEGGSTITMQLVRNLYLSREQTFERKVTEAIMAVRLEQTYSKEEILDWYLNTVPYGSNAYGAQAASEVFFNKNASEITVDESAFLAALPKATTFYSPYGENASALRARQKVIFRRMVEEGFLSMDEYREVMQIDTFAKLRPQEELIRAPHFVFYVLEKLEEEYGEDLLRVGGLRVYTTIDLEMQSKAEEVVAKGALRNQSQYNAENAALVAIDPRTGEILAMAGSRDYFDSSIDGEVNVATRLRQPGSAFKPIAYAKALELGLEPETMIYDVRTSFGPDGTGGEYIPGNYGGNFMGRISLRSALANSLNIPAVKILYIAGLDNTIELAERLGITSLTDRNRYGLSLVLGGGEVQLLELTGAFGVFANDGLRAPTNGIIKIEGISGNLVENFQRQSERVIDAGVARKINSMLSDNQARTPVFGPQSDLYFPEKDVAAKTGTTQEYRDGWTVGYTPTIAVGVWVGNNDNRPMKIGSDGVFVAAPLWREYMEYAIDRMGDEVPFIEPPAPRKSVIPQEGGENGGRSLLYYVSRAKLSGAPLYDPKMIERWDAAISRQKQEEKEEDKEDD